MVAGAVIGGFGQMIRGRAGLRVVAGTEGSRSRARRMRRLKGWRDRIMRDRITRDRVVIARGFVGRVMLAGQPPGIRGERGQ